VIKALRLYEPEESRLNEFQKRAIETLYQLRDQVKNGRLPISTIQRHSTRGYWRDYSTTESV